MNRFTPALFGLFFFLTICAPVASQEAAEENVPIPLRVTSAGPGLAVVVDRGKSEGLALGDSVVFNPRVVVVIDPESSDGMNPGDQVVLHPQQDTIYRGVVSELDHRSAVVELTDRSHAPAPGTQGEALVPFARAEATREAREQRELEEAEQTQDDSDYDWSNADENWSPGMSLLAGVKPVRPEDRSPRITGRAFVSFDFNQTSESDASDSLFRAGTDFDYENPLGYGGRLRFGAEAFQREFDDPDERDDSDFAYRLDRLSYSRGGTRFAGTRWEVGRFLQQGFPEFGVLDGLEWGKRTTSGNRFGASIGWMPEPDADFDTGRDFQLAAYYEWVADDREELVLGAGFQKSFHNGSGDRDLLIGKARYNPPEGWDFFGTVWVDFYGSRDDAKDNDVEVTQAYLTTSRRWDRDRGVDFTYRRLLFPELERNEFIPITAEALADNRYDRISASGFVWLNPRRKLHGEIGLWDDEDEAGGDLEVGLKCLRFFTEGDQAEFVLFGTAAQFEDLYGTRIGYAKSAWGQGRWSLFYEFVQHKLDGFSSRRDDIPQHRLRGTIDLYTAWKWTLSFYGQGHYWDEEGAFSGGFYVQKSF